MQSLEEAPADNDIEFVRAASPGTVKNWIFQRSFCPCHAHVTSSELRLDKELMIQMTSVILGFAKEISLLCREGQTVINK